MNGPLAAMTTLLAACTSVGEPGPSGPYALVLGTAQDAGLPHVGCERECCAAARRDPARRRMAASVLIVDPRTGGRWLLDATPDLPEQVELARGHGASHPGDAGRPALFDGIFLTHAHIGHYTGLMYLGREAWGGATVPVYGSQRMTRFLSENGPWDLLGRLGHVRFETLAPDRPLALAQDLTITALPVPHRGEYTDTLAFVVRGPGRSLLYLPDIDKWERWERRVEDVLVGVDVALLDGSFHAEGEIPGRSMAEIPHPFLVESLARFAPLSAAERAKVRFLHLNHTNPAADPQSAAARAVRAAGMAIAREGDVIGL